MVVLASASPSSSSSSSESDSSWRLPAHLKLGGGDAILLPRERADLGPRFDLSWEQAVELQLAALRDNDKPCFDHGVEVMYRFASFDPFQRSAYFGKSFDLGQFERFRRIMHIPAYKPLLNHDAATTLSTLRVSERCFKTRLHVTGEGGHDEGVFEITMVQRLGGRYDGWWFTESLVADGNDWRASIISY